MKGASQTRAGWLEQALRSLDRLCSRRCRASALPGHLLTGIEGEEAACHYLRLNGYTLVARRWAAGNIPGDLDLIAWQGTMLCFFEVKTRTAHDITPAEAAVDIHKQNILWRLARQYVRQLSGEPVPQARFDVISVYLVPGRKHEITHFENAFGWNERQRD